MCRRSPSSSVPRPPGRGQPSRPWCQETPEGVVLNVRAQPRSSRAGLDGLLGDAVKVRIRAAPVDGKANRELIETLADAFGLPKSCVVFKGGETSKTKRILLVGLTASAVEVAVRVAARRQH
mgnify:CR=1 FL=1